MACAAIWRVAINHYTERLDQPPIPDDLTSIMTLYTHLQATDPERFVVATRADAEASGGERVIGFAAAVVRGTAWYLSMLFVLPEEQGLGLGRALLERVLPPADAGWSHGTAIDSAQPISAALYSQYGMPPRMPLLHLLGEVRHPEKVPGLPTGVSATPFEAIVAGPADGSGHRELAATVAAIDTELLGYEHPQDHRYLRGSGRRGFLYRDTAGVDLGYAYGSEVGRVGPVARAPARVARTGARARPWRDPAARRVRRLGTGIRHGRRHDAPRRRAADRGVPDPRLLGPAIGRLQPLPADLAGIAVGLTDSLFGLARRAGRRGERRARAGGHEAISLRVAAY